jgi:hypothetical protein
MLRSFRQRPDAARAQHFANHSTLLHHGDLLKVGAEGAPGCAEGEAAIISKRRRLTTLIALCHCLSPFLRHNCYRARVTTRQNEKKFYHNTYPFSSIDVN